ncbi:MAG: 4Fe-4S dicluster domain-containing protein [Clostridia bacterium]|nr:4Fe-4S dicluster domain-containing protein [Clostridia bacterium]
MSLTNKVTAEDVLRISGVDASRCMQCGKCSGACPNYDEMDLHPHQFAALLRKGEVERLMESNALYQCLSCFACSQRCPRNVEPAKIIEAVRLTVIRQKGRNYMTADRLPEKLDEDLPQQALVSAMRKYSK